MRRSYLFVMLILFAVPSLLSAQCESNTKYFKKNEKDYVFFLYAEMDMSHISTDKVFFVSNVYKVTYHSMYGGEDDLGSDKFENEFVKFLKKNIHTDRHYLIRKKNAHEDGYKAYHCTDLGEVMKMRNARIAEIKKNFPGTTIKRSDLGITKLGYFQYEKLDTN